MSMEELTLPQALILLGGAGAVLAFVRKAWPFARDLVLFVVEIVGAPARDGKPARPGLMARLEQLTERVERVEDTAAQAASASAAATEGVHHLSQQVAEVDRKVDEVAAEQTRVRSAVEDLRGQSGTEATTPDQTTI